MMKSEIEQTKLTYQYNDDSFAVFFCGGQEHPTDFFFYICTFVYVCWSFSFVSKIAFQMETKANHILQMSLIKYCYQKIVHT